MADNVEHPAHYTSYRGIEVIDLTEQMNFNRGNVVKYVSRAGLKDPSKEIEDLMKARWYLDREISRLQLDSEQTFEVGLMSDEEEQISALVYRKK